MTLDLAVIKYEHTPRYMLLHHADVFITLHLRLRQTMTHNIWKWHTLLFRPYSVFKVTCLTLPNITQEVSGRKRRVAGNLVVFSRSLGMQG